MRAVDLRPATRSKVCVRVHLIRFTLYFNSLVDLSGVNETWIIGSAGDFARVFTLRCAVFGPLVGACRIILDPLKRASSVVRDFSGTTCATEHPKWQFVAERKNNIGIFGENLRSWLINDPGRLKRGNRLINPIGRDLGQDNVWRSFSDRRLQRRERIGFTAPVI